MKLTYYLEHEYHQTGNGPWTEYRDPQTCDVDPNDYETVMDVIILANALNHTRLDVNLEQKEYEEVSPAVAKRLTVFSSGDLQWISQGMTLDIAQVFAHRCGYKSAPKGPTHLQVTPLCRNRADEYSDEVLWQLMLLRPHALWPRYPLYDRINEMDHWYKKLAYMLQYGRRKMHRILTG